MKLIKIFKIIILFSLFNACSLQAPKFQTLGQARNKLRRHKKYSNFKAGLNNQQGINAFDVFPADIWAEIINFLIGDQEQEISYETLQAILNLRSTSRDLKELINISIKPLFGWLKHSHMQIHSMQIDLRRDPIGSLEKALNRDQDRLLEKILKQRAISDPILKLRDKIEIVKNNKNKNFSNKKIIELLENRLTLEKRDIYFLCIISIMGAFLEEYILANLSDYITGIENDICYNKELEYIFRRSPILINNLIKGTSILLNNYFKTFDPKVFIPISIDFEGPKNLTNFLITKKFKDLNEKSNDIFKVDDQDNYKARIKNRLHNPLVISEIVSCVIVFMVLLEFHLVINKIIQENFLRDS